MSDLAIGLLSFPALLGLIFLRVPIGLAMFLAGFAGLVLVSGDAGLPLARLKSETFTTFSSYSLSIIPMFLLMGQFASLGGMSQALFNAAAAWLGHRRGGVAMAAVGACAGFGAICGSSLATAATMGRVALPELRRHGYSGGFSTATLAAGGTLGILIPPSVVLVIYAILTEQNIAKLFLAAVIPGVLAALGYMLAISLYVRLNPGTVAARPPLPLAARFAALGAVWPVLLVFALVVGGIYRGWFTPTEGAAVGALGTAVIAWANGGLTLTSLTQSFMVTARSTAMIFFIVLGAAFYNGFLALTQVPQEVAAYVAGLGLGPLVILLVILLFYLLLGCLMDSLSMILLTIPIFWPVVQGLDFGFVSMADLHAARAAEALTQGLALAPDVLAGIKGALAEGGELTRDQLRALEIRGASPGALARINGEQVAIWFGILVLIVVEVGLITPPVGMNLFIINTMDRETPISDTYRAVVYFVLSDLLRVALLVAFPLITLVFIPI
ncbi:TRAP transporter large permease [Oceaniglobus trochenteri]|uniref:TRAP transporter large permease n=1 Tax=Oceaniglobus trochenteri TaxID=2763260 RepID=UPI001CFF5C97|nr:TRAP transporter large permease [Oceaniglobus trochenteri]